MVLLCSSESPSPTYVLKSCLRAVYGLAASHEANNRALGNDLLLAVRDLSKKTADPDLVGPQSKDTRPQLACIRGFNRQDVFK